MRMIKFLFITPLLLTSLFLFACSHQENRSKGDRSEYLKISKEILRLNEKQASGEEISRHALKLLDLSKSIYTDFLADYPQCRDYLEIVAQSLDKMLKLSLEDLEQQYHEGNALPQADYQCHTAKELIVHPVTIISIVNQHELSNSKRELIEEEILELIAHLKLLP